MILTNNLLCTVSGIRIRFICRNKMIEFICSILFLMPTRFKKQGFKEFVRERIKKEERNRRLKREKENYLTSGSVSRQTKLGL